MKRRSALWVLVALGIVIWLMLRGGATRETVTRDVPEAGDVVVDLVKR